MKTTHRLISLAFALMATAGLFAADYDSLRVYNVCMQAMESIDRRMAQKMPVDGLKKPQKEMKKLCDSIEFYLDRYYEIDAFLCARRLYAISDSYGLAMDPRQNLTYLKALVSAKGPAKFLKNVRAYVNSVDSADRRLMRDALMALARYSVAANKPDEAIEVTRRALKYCDNDEQKANLLANMAFAALDNQDFDLYRETLAVLEPLVNKKNQSYLDFLNLKATEHAYYGRAADGHACRLECAAVAGELYGTGSLQWLYYANKAFSSLVAAGDYAAAADMIATMTGCIEANSGHVVVAEMIFNIGGFMERAGSDLGLDLMRAAFDHRAEIIGRDNAAATMAGNLAFAYRKHGNLAKAVDYQDLEVAILYLSIGNGHRSMLRARGNHLVYLVEAGEYKKARKSAKSFLTSYRTSVPRLFGAMTSKERFELLGNQLFRNTIGNLIPSLGLAGIIDPSTAYSAALEYKGILLATELDLQEKIKQSGDDSLRRDYERYRIMLKKLDRLGPQDEECKALSEEVDAMEHSLLSRSKSLYGAVRPTSIYDSDIQYWLKDDEMAVEFIQALFGDGKKVYGALCLRHGYLPEPDLIVFGNDDDFDSIPPDQFYTSPKLYELVWRPMLKRNPDVKKIFFAPSEKFHEIAIEHVPDASGTPVSEKLKMRRLSSTRLVYQEREKAAFAASDSLPVNVALFGGINYYPDEEEILESMPDTAAVDRSALRSAIDKSRFASSVVFLPGTLSEVNDINGMFASKGTSAQTYVGASGSEETFKSLSGKGITHLHIATHGFYESEKGSGGEDEMLGRTGLLMAGAGVDLSQFEGMVLDDGVLTAGEIARMDFEALDLVVLSACETALGDSGSDGVFGLQRGFKKAGAKSIMMSLAKVDDRATQILMRAFYRNLLDGHGKAEALAMAQRYLRQAENGRYDSPRFWAPFIILDAID